MPWKQYIYWNFQGYIDDRNKIIISMKPNDASPKLPSSFTHTTAACIYAQQRLAFVSTYIPKASLDTTACPVPYLGDIRHASVTFSPCFYYELLI